ncbi:GNAT family acetyltransferase [Bradyrhizobium lablabi]|uniref:GNAT family acetyltransferase n=1 Tax=Bradyrhizobium lablabi TaxID=722472 RepID=UPI001BAB54CC|nr:GNAT family acetyltransferase [Bradyrhizobium lablabi]MBR1125277.1 GNAT family acetyltransferase [Bradyrhizobium lablabi]
MSASPLSIAPIEDADVPAVVSLWQRCDLTRPWNDPAADIALARRGPNSAILTGRDGDAIVATVMVGHEGHRGWVYYVAVDPDHQGKGHGRAIMAAAEDWLRQAGIAKVQLLVRPDNNKVQAFYESLDYDEQERIIYAKWLDGREPTP